jgi:hypothetical protein
MPPDSSPGLASALCDSAANSSSCGMRARICRVLQAEVAAIDQQVLGAGEVRVQRVHLAHHAQLRLDGQRVARHVWPKAVMSPASGTVRPRHMRMVVVLPAPLGPITPRHSPGAMAKRQVVHHGGRRSA